MRMREIISKIPLNEAHSYRLTSATGEPFIAIENPSFEQMKTMEKRAPYNELRGVLSKDGMRLIIWPAYYAHHGEGLGFILGYNKSALFPHGEDDDMYIVPEMKDWICVFPTTRGVFTYDGRVAQEIIDSSPIVSRIRPNLPSSPS